MAPFSHSLLNCQLHFKNSNGYLISTGRMHRDYYNRIYVQDFMKDVGLLRLAEQHTVLKFALSRRGYVVLKEAASSSAPFI